MVDHVDHLTMFHKGYLCWVFCPWLRILSASSLWLTLRPMVDQNSHCFFFSYYDMDSCSTHYNATYFIATIWVNHIVTSSTIPHITTIFIINHIMTLLVVHHDVTIASIIHHITMAHVTCHIAMKHFLCHIIMVFVVCHIAMVYDS